MAFDLERYAAECGVADPAGFAAGCEKLRLLLVDANTRTNLTRITEPGDFAVKHVADSLSIVRMFPELATEKRYIADIGCGAGFPSLVLALGFPRLLITAIDSTGKKTAFVAQAAAALELANLRVVTGRSRELNLKPEYKYRFDIVTARAVADLATICADARNFVRRGGCFMLYKTPEQVKTELADREELAEKLQLDFRLSDVFELPENAGSRQFVRADVR
jgi:16S rRNA (guanine527-N7)-methyltransferase